ncbi:NUMOD3 domain-containing DNA-binding protein [Corallibacter sp.]|uniref:NUMOD3 domain-containing DNA-binding protein n=1 Tax=Corallibacter sp. TaxID=2038084 RepID=UPI003AB13684
MSNVYKTTYHYTYITVNQLTGQSYIGIHSTDNLDDGYMGSGYRLCNAIKKHGKGNFKTTILQFYPTRKEALKAEEYIVDDTFINFDWTYNLTTGGQGFSSKEDHPYFGKKRPKEHCIAISEGRKGIVFSDEHLENMSKCRMGELHHFFGKKRPDFAKKMRGRKYGSKTEEVKQKISNSRKGKNTGKNNHKSKVVLNINTGIFYETLREAANAINVKYGTARTRFNQNFKNNPLVYV